MGQGWISSAQTKSREAAHLHRRIAGPIYFNYDTESAPRRYAPLHQLWHRRIPGYSSSTALDHLHQYARGHHRRQPSTSTNSVASPPSPTVVIVNANKIFYFFN
jgi:hypothetical protein